MSERTPLTPGTGQAARGADRRDRVPFFRVARLALFFALLVSGCAHPPPPEPSFALPADNLTKWARVRDAENADPSFTHHGPVMPDAFRAAAWSRLRRDLPRAEIMEKLETVTAFFNQWPYTQDKDLWGVEDYWALPKEFVLWSGDCEDYAVTKYYALRYLGVPAEDMRIAGVWNARRGEGHAVLIVFVEGAPYMLDNFTDKVLPWNEAPYYEPVFYVNEATLWVHGPEELAAPP